MQKSSVKTLSIIDTLSQVVREEPAKLLLDDNSNNKRVASNNNNNNNAPPQLQKRSPKVNVPSTPPFNGGRQSLTTSPIVANGNVVPNGFATSSPNGVITSSNVVPPLAARKKKKKRPALALAPSAHNGAGHATPDWIRNIFEHARGGAIGRLVAGMGLDMDFDEVQEIGEKYKQAFNRLKIDPAYDQPLYPNIRTCIEAARAKGMVIAIATGKSRKGLESVLDQHDLHSLIDDSITADEAQSKPHPDMLLQLMMRNGIQPHHTAMIGDTSFDIEMAVAAACLPVGVDWGNHDGAVLVDAGAQIVLEDAAALLPWLAANGFD